ncbi:MAG: hypothetical protein ACOCU8_01225 [Patescibacteria group bacterium]
MDQYNPFPFPKKAHKTQAEKLKKKLKRKNLKATASKKLKKIQLQTMNKLYI